MREIDKILNEDEQVLWEGKPVFLPYFLSSFFGLIVIAIFFFIIPFFGFIFAIIIILGLAYSFLVYENIHYAITDKRVIFQSGLIGRDFQTVDFDQVTNAEVNVDIFDKIFGGNTGSVLVQSAGMFTQTKSGAVPKPSMIAHIPNPYEVFKFFKKASFDVKADIQYPNKLRPKENVGYNTQYEGKMKK
ncbi:MAG: PH domain-containing protein [archaeon]|nr:PH domain-containing protein [archaeon]